MSPKVTMQHRIRVKYKNSRSLEVLQERFVCSTNVGSTFPWEVVEEHEDCNYAREDVLAMVLAEQVCP